MIVDVVVDADADVDVVAVVLLVVVVPGAEDDDVRCTHLFEFV